MWIERQIAGELRRLASSFPALVLVGPRQVGKTALLERAFGDYAYVPPSPPSRDGRPGSSRSLGR